MNCFICHQELQEYNETLNVCYCTCKKCGHYGYEKNFLTTYNYYFSVNSDNKKEKIESFLKRYVKKHQICFVDDFETSTVENYELLEFRDVLNLVGLEVTHNNTIDSNWKD